MEGVKTIRLPLFGREKPLVKVVIVPEQFLEDADFILNDGEEVLLTEETLNTTTGETEFAYLRAYSKGGEIRIDVFARGRKLPLVL